LAASSPNLPTALNRLFSTFSVSTHLSPSSQNTYAAMCLSSAHMSTPRVSKNRIRVARFFLVQHTKTGKIYTKWP
jgi:hypothetical protein